MSTAASQQCQSGTPLKNAVLASLTESKAIDICQLDVHELTTITDTIIVCSGSVSRHVKAIANRLLTDIKQQGFSVYGTEGENRAEWILVDLSDVIVHIMLPETREFYQLEKLWSVSGDPV